MKKLSIRYPWQQLKAGQGFFVPCLDTESTRVEGLKNALRYRILSAKAEAGVLNGQLGVLFRRGKL